MQLTGLISGGTQKQGGGAVARQCRHSPPQQRRSPLAGESRRRRRLVPRAYTVELEMLSGAVESFSVEEGSTVLETALERGLELKCDCMMDDEAKAKGYALLCVSEPTEDCRIKIIEEDELLEEVLCSSQNIE